MAATEEGDLEVRVIDLREDDDEEQDIRLFKRPAGKVLRELLPDPKLTGCQHFGFKEHKDAGGTRILGGHTNGSVSFQLAQIKVGQDTVPISIVLYIDWFFIKLGIPILPVYCEII